eukprot:7623505-Pyramimonas_sp.AAC.1
MSPISSCAWGFLLVLFSSWVGLLRFRLARGRGRLVGAPCAGCVCQVSALWAAVGASWAPRALGGPPSFLAWWAAVGASRCLRYSAC